MLFRGRFNHALTADIFQLLNYLYPLIFWKTRS